MGVRLFILSDESSEMDKIKAALRFTLVLSLLMSCSNPSQTFIDLGWTDVGASYGTLPEYVSVYGSPASLNGKPVVAYIAVVDMKCADWDVWSVRSDISGKTDDAYKPPSQVYEDTKAPIIVNGGFFFWSDGNYTSSLAVSNGEVLAYNINYASEDWISVYYPTRAAFVQKKDGKFDACWTYATSSGQHYAYQTPADNSYSKSPLDVPSATFPEKASEFEAQTAIGGGPVLINKGKIVDTWKEELFEVGGVEPASSQPRTAVGVTSDKKMIMFVCEGRNMTEGVKGMTTAEVAEILKDLGCVEAINLDGGGSTCMLVNGKETIKVSDGAQRAVASAVYFK